MYSTVMVPGRLGIALKWPWPDNNTYMGQHCLFPEAILTSHCGLLFGA